MHETPSTIFALGLAVALFALPACGDKTTDKADADKSADKSDADKSADKSDADKSADKSDADKAGAADKAAAVAKLDGDGRVDIIVDAGGYHPAEIQAPAKAKVTLAFKRVTEAGCGQELVIASMDIKKDLPLDEAVEIEVEVPETGELGFACGMNMYKGKVVPKS